MNGVSMVPPGSDPPFSLGKISRGARTLVANGLVYPLSKLPPRRPDLWLFGHQDGEFKGNSKFLFLWVTAHRPDIRAIWITDNDDALSRLKQLGLPVCRKDGPLATWLAMRAGAYFVCHGPGDISLPLSGGALLVNLWHGVGLKALRLGDPKSDAYKYAQPSVGWLDRTRHLGPWIKPDVLVTTSPFMQQHFTAQFGLAPEQCPILGYPRLDSSRSATIRQSLERIPGSEAQALWRDGAREVYAYVPTFRDSKRRFLQTALPDLNRLEGALEKRDAVLYVKPHRHTGAAELTAGAKVRLWPADVDLDAALPHLTGLITDFSSVHYDYIFHREEGSILYLFDEEEYTSTDRLLLWPLEENTAGWRARSFDELLDLIATGRALQPHPDVLRIREKFWGKSDRPASPRIVQHVERILSERYGKRLQPAPLRETLVDEDPTSTSVHSGGRVG